MMVGDCCIYMEHYSSENPECILFQLKNRCTLPIEIHCHLVRNSQHALQQFNEMSRPDRLLASPMHIIRDVILIKL